MMEISENTIKDFFEHQLAVWDTARNNFDALNGVKVKSLTVGGSEVKVQFNSARIVSSAAKVDVKSLKDRCARSHRMG